MNNFARKCYPILSSKPCSEKKKSVKKETQKPQNRHDDEDQLENIEVQQKLKKARVCSRGCTVVVSRKNEDFKVEILEAKSLRTANKFLFVKFILRNLRDLSSDSLKFRSSYL